MDHAVGAFITLLADDANWRNKLLKVIQYAARLLAWAHGAASAGGNVPPDRIRATVSRALLLMLTAGGVPPPARLKDTAKHISLARRIMTWGDSVVYTRDLLALLNKSATSRAMPDAVALVSAVVNATSGMLEDVNTASKIGVVTTASLPKRFSYYVNVCWAVQCCWSLGQALVKLRASLAKLSKCAATVCTAARACGCSAPAERPVGAPLICRPLLRRAVWPLCDVRGLAADPDYDNVLFSIGFGIVRPTARPSTILELHDAVKAWAAAHVDAYSVFLNVLKCLCDTGQSVPSALETSIVPEWLDICFGLGSGVISCMRVWQTAIAKDAPARTIKPTYAAVVAAGPAAGTPMVNGTPAASRTVARTPATSVIAHADASHGRGDSAPPARNGVASTPDHAVSMAHLNGITSMIVEADRPFTLSPIAEHGSPYVQTPSSATPSHALVDGVHSATMNGGVNGHPSAYKRLRVRVRMDRVSEVFSMSQPSGFRSPDHAP